jgi:hypothetical protein
MAVIANQRLKGVTMTHRLSLLSVAAWIWISGSVSSNAQVYDPNSGIQYNRGQDVQPAFEGWKKNTDGTYTFYFGYLNRNYEEQVDVPLGPGNGFDRGTVDLGQPTHFYARRHMFVFTVKVGKDWGPDDKLTWTLTTHGHTDRAKASLNPAWQMDNGVISENAGSGVVDWSNEAPSISGSGPQTITLPNVAKLTVNATDDGLPKAKKRRNAELAKPTDELTGIPSIIPEYLTRGSGLGIKWILYRGPGPVGFDPPVAPAVSAKQLTSTTTVKFSVPGNYRLRAIASDGALETNYDFDIAVNPDPAGAAR